MKIFSKSLLKFSSYCKVLVLLLLMSGFNGYSQNLISVPFNEGFVGDNTANNVSSNSKYLSALGWKNVQFTQNSSAFIFVAQGNDIPGTVLITDNLDFEYSIPGFIKWRTPSGNNITTPVFVPTTGATLATNSSNGSATYEIKTTSYIGLTFNGNTLTIPQGGDVTGNAATSGILDALNAYLGALPKISISDVTVSEGAGTATVTVSISTSSTNAITVNYATANVSASAGNDYVAKSGTLTFAANTTTLSQTITFTINDDADLESFETFNIILSDAINAAVLDGTSIIGITDNDAAAITTTGTLTPFTSCTGTVSAEQSFTVSGSGLSADIVVTAPTGYEVSKTTGTAFAGSVSITSTSGTVASTTLYVRLKSNAANGASGNITVVSDTSSKNIATGTAVVSATSVAGTIAGAASVCAGTNSTALTLSGNVGTVTKWQSSTVADFSSAVTDIANTTLSLTATNLTTTTYYRAVVTSGSCASATTAVVTVTVNPLPVAPTAVSPQFICAGDTFLNLQATTVAGNTIEWYAAATGGTALTTSTPLVIGATYYAQAVSALGCGSPRTPVQAIQNNALNFDGVNDYVNIGDTIEGFTDMTSEAWVYWNGSTLNFSEIFTKDVVSSMAITSANKLHANFGNGTSWIGSVDSNTSIPLNTWTHVAITRTTGTVRLFVNGVQDSATITNSSVGSNSAPRLIGGKMVGASVAYTLFTGSIDEVRFWNFAKTQAQIQAAMTSNLTGSESGLLAYYTFNQGVAAGDNSAITGVADKSTNAYTGAFNGFSKTGTTSNFVNGYEYLAFINGAATVCSGTNTTTLTFGGSIRAIQWQSRTGSNAFADISGATSATLNATNLTTTTDYRAVVTNTGSCAPATTNVVTITVNPLPEAVIYGVNTICEGNSIVLSAAPSATDVSYTATLSPEAITNASSGWQSFTSGVTGQLSKVSFGFKNTGTPANSASFIAKLNIYSGSGNTPANLVRSQFVTVNQPTTGFVSQDFILNSPVPVTASTAYTAELVAASALDKISFLNTNNTVNTTGGTANVNATTDYYFTNQVIASPASNLTFQWKVDTGSGFTNVATSGTNQFLVPTTAGNYKVVITNTTTTCSNTSAAKTVTVDPKPVVNAGADVSICGTVGTTYKLVNASVSNAGLIFVYSSGTGTFDSQIIAQPTYRPSQADLAAGFVNLTFIVGGTAACASEVGFDQMRLNFAKAPIANAGVDATICSNEVYTAIGIAENGTVAWTTDGTGTFSQDTNPVYTPSPADISSGSVTLTITVTGTEVGCTSSVISDTVTVTITPAATASAGPASVSVCTGLNYTASAAVATNATSIVWTTAGTGSFNTASLVKPVYTPSAADIAAGSVVLTMTANGTGSCNAVSTITLLFTAVPTANAGVDDAICSDATFTANGIATGGTVKWTTSGGGTFNGDTIINAVYTPAATDTNVTLTMTVTGINECASFAPVVDTMLLTVTPAPTANAGDATASMCSNTTYQTLGTAANGSIKWTSTGTGSFSNDAIANPIYTPSAADITSGLVTLTIEVTGTTGACLGIKKTDTIALTISPNPTVNAGPATAIICGGTTYQTAGTATNGTILWTTSGSGTFNDATIASPIYTPGVAETSGTVTLTMTVTGATGCALVAPTDTVVLSIFTTAATFSKVDVSCYAGNNASITLVPSGGVAPYTYVWKKGTSPISGSSNEQFNLTAGDYSCVVTDSNGCSATIPVTIAQPSSALRVTPSQTNVTTNNGGNGTATVTVAGGTESYTYAWSPSGGSGATASNLSAGSYTATITDAKGCLITQSFTITEPSAFIVTSTATNVSCNGASNGTAEVIVTGGRTPYTYLWSTGATTASVTGLAPGDYTCLVTENNGSGETTTRSFTITQPAVLAAAATQTNVGIHGGSTGSATVTATGGTATYTYVWKKDTTVLSSTLRTIANLQAGNYTCTITDAKGCFLIQNFTITQPAVFAVDNNASTATNVDCFGSATGSAKVVMTGGVAPYSYSWTPNVSTGDTAINLTARRYTCSITDANGATQTKIFEITQPAATLSATSTSTAILCYGGTSTASVTATGGTGSYSYSWSPSGETGSSATLTAGSYICTITDENGCEVTKDFLITQPAAALSATTTQTNIAVFGSSTGSALVTVSGGTASYAYSWSPSVSTTQFASGLVAGTYSCIVTDANGCTITQSFTITQASSITASVASTSVSCFGGNDGTATVSDLVGGSGRYTYLWSPSGGTDAIASGLNAGTYSCYIRDINGAFITKTVTVTQPSAALSAILTKLNPSINGASTGTATATVTGGTAPYTYLWSNGTTVATATNLGAGTYTCTVTDAKNCTTTKTIVLTEPTALVVNTANTNVSCYGGTNGTAGVSASGGVLPYSYVWSPSVGVGATLTGLAAGTYVCTITDANGAQVQKTIDVTQPAALITSVERINASCFGSATGSAGITVSGGTGAYTYSWSKGITALSATTNSVSNLTAGDYKCVVTDENGCSVTTLFTITAPSIVVVSSTQTNATSHGGNNGAATVAVSGGTAPYTYSWSNGDENATATNLSSGSYTCTITDANGCIATKIVTITQPTVLAASTVSTNVSCYGGSNGTAAVIVSGGLTNYTYLWSTGATTDSVTGLSAGTYSCTIKDNNGTGISIIKEFTITQPLELSATTAQTDVAIYGTNNGAATVTVSGGTAPYLYSWNNSGGTAATASNLFAGAYTCTITDAKGCTLTQDFTITQPAAFIVDNNASTTTNVNCYGSATGAATVVMIGGVTPYSYTWSPNVSITETASNLIAGTYTCTVTDANGATKTKTFTIAQPSVLSATSISPTVSCYGGSVTASVTATGGTGTYSYLWSSSKGTASSASLTAGDYSCTITDSNGCTLVKNFTISQPEAALSATQTQNNVLVYGAATGSATVNTVGGTTPYTYSWSQGGTGATASNLVAGTYSCTITDAKGCSITTSFTITQAILLTASVANTNVSCYGGNNGTATVSDVVGGSESYIYLWSPSGGSNSTASGLKAGGYTCTITDTNGAFITKTVTVTQPSAALSTILSKVNPLINGALTGAATATVSGGTAPYSYLWSNETTTATATNLGAGTYICTVTDANNCTTTRTIVLTEPTALVVNTANTNVSCYGGTNGTAGVSASGGVLPYSYVWSPSVGVGATLTGLSAGTYVCTIKDANGAEVQKTIEVTQPTALATSVEQLNVGCNGIASGSATITVSGGVSPYTYSWSPSGGNTPTASNLVAGNYSCRITDANGCIVIRNITIIQASLLSATTSKLDVKCNGANTGSATVSVTGGNPSYSYLWSHGATTATASNLTAGSYSCTITDTNGCSLVKNFTINQPTVLNATVSQSNVICNGQATGSASVSVSGGVSPYTYSWSPSGGNQSSATNLVAGVYTCTITDANLCTLVKIFTITELALIPTPTADAGPATASICSGSTYSTSGTATGGTISWTSNGSGTFDNPAIANAIYTASAADKATGTVTLTMTVTPPGSCGISLASDRVVVKIFPVSAGGIIAGATTVCTGINSTTLKLSEYTGSIQWQSSTNNSTFTDISGANAATYIASNLTATTYYKAVVTSGVCSSSESVVATITVSPSSVAGSISGATSVCSGTNSTTLSLSENTGLIQWQSSPDNVTFTTIIGATSATYTATNLTTTKYYRAAVTKSVCSVVNSAAVAITVNPIPVADAGPASTIICGGTAFRAAANAQNGTVTWSNVIGTGTFADATIANAVYIPSASDIANGSVTLRMTVTGSLLGCSTNTATDTIVVTINSPAAPTAEAIQNICYVGIPKVIDLKTTLARAVKWYLTPVNGTALDPNTNLVSGNTYYGTQTIAGCESITRTAVYVNLTCELTAVKDNFAPINGYTGGSTPSVLANDLLNGRFVKPSEIVLTGVTIPSGFIFNSDGTVTVPAGMASGEYDLIYKICEVADLSNCSQVTATIIVASTTIVAVKDEYGPINGVQGETTLSVLANDYLNGVLLSPIEISLSSVILPTPLVLNANGTITIPPGTPSGIYELKYKITENLNPSNASQGNVTIIVGACLDFPINDCDGDGVTNGQEMIDETNPSDSCSLNFMNQSVTTRSSWNDSDCDGDGVTNRKEVLDGTDPIDGCAFVLSHSTVATLSSWNNTDCDGDGVKNGQEVIDGTNPSDSCSLNPVHISGVTSAVWNDLDCDGDGVKNKQELLDGTSPTDLCSFNPNHITLVTSAAWKISDCDGDGVTNGREIVDGTNPKDSCTFITANQTVATNNLWNNLDCDGDGVINRKEILDGTNPLDLCSFVLAHQTVLTAPSWNNADCDGDGVVNTREVADKTDPNDACSLISANQTVATTSVWNNLDCDGDGVVNGQEIEDGTDIINYCSSIPAHITVSLSEKFLEDDCDGDGIVNEKEIGPSPKAPFDFNGNDIPDYLETNNHTESEDDLEIFKSLTPNGNGENDVFVIRNINLYPKNTVTVFNRWGVIVYEEEGYGNNDKFFRGYSDGRCTMKKGVELPIGAYFYQVRYTNNQGIEKSRTGYLFINK